LDPEDRAATAGQMTGIVAGGTEDVEARDRRTDFEELTHAAQGDDVGHAIGWDDLVDQHSCLTL
jgi:hypothetical protein